jgi:hypothetical protein
MLESAPRTESLNPVPVQYPKQAQMLESAPRTESLNPIYRYSTLNKLKCSRAHQDKQGRVEHKKTYGHTGTAGASMRTGAHVVTMGRHVRVRYPEQESACPLPRARNLDRHVRVRYSRVQQSLIGRARRLDLGFRV